MSRPLVGKFEFTKFSAKSSSASKTELLPLITVMNVSFYSTKEKYLTSQRLGVSSAFKQ